MKRAGETPPIPKAPAKAPSALRRRLVKAAAWTLAVPALCAAVLVGGAAPLYLLLPDAKPAAGTRSVAAPESPSAPPSGASLAMAEPAEAGALETVDEIDATQTSSTTPSAVPDEPGEAPLDEAATVRPTPRPAMPLPYSPPVSGDGPRAVAAVAAPSPAERAASAERKPPEKTAAEAPLEGRRAVVRTAAKLRSAPQGAQIGVLPDGAEIVVGRCDSWCEVSANGRRGFVYAALIDGTREAAGRAERRIGTSRARQELADERDVDARREAYDRPRYERRAGRFAEEGRGGYRPWDAERRFHERAYRRGVDPDWLEDDPDRSSGEPDWLVENAPPLLRDEGPDPFYDAFYP